MKWETGWGFIYVLCTVKSLRDAWIFIIFISFFALALIFTHSTAKDSFSFCFWLYVFFILSLSLWTPQDIPFLSLLLPCMQYFRVSLWLTLIFLKNVQKFKVFCLFRKIKILLQILRNSNQHFEFNLTNLNSSSWLIKKLAVLWHGTGVKLNPTRKERSFYFKTKL